MTQDYQQECGLSRYPFKDNATLVWTNGVATGVLPNNLILDANFTIGDGGTVRPTLTSIEYDGVLWTLNFSTLPGLQITDTQTITTFSIRSADTHNLLRVDVDTLAVAAYFSDLGLTGTFTFTAPGMLATSCIRLLPPKVTRLQLSSNTQIDWNSSPSSENILDITSGGLILAEGSNVGLEDRNSHTNINVVANNGTGQYQDCPTSIAEVRSINNNKSNSEGNFFLINDGCLTVNPAPNALNIANACKADCQPDHITHFAHYLNRVTAYYLELIALYSAANSSYTSLLADYTELAINTHQPYVMAQAINQSNKVNNYLNITCGIYNPTNTTPNCKLQVLMHSRYLLASKSVYFTQNTVRKQLPDFEFTNIEGELDSGFAYTNEMLLPASTSYCSLVLQVPVAIINLGDSLNDVSFNLLDSNNNVISTYVLSPLAPAFNYNVSISQSRSTTTKFITITVDLYNNKTNSTAVASLRLTTPGALSLVSSKLAQGSTVTDFSSLGFHNITLSYDQSNQYTAVLACPITTTQDGAIIIAGNDNTGSSTKTINVGI